MAARGNRGGAGERVLESKHVIGLFMLMLVFSSVFFALGYVMGRNQYDGQVRAASNPRSGSDVVMRSRPDVTSKRGNISSPPATPDTSDPATQPSSDWGFYNSGKNSSDDNLKPVSSSGSLKTAPVNSKNRLSSPSAPAGNYTIQVAALRRESDAFALANTLQKKKFPAFVTAPQADKYYHVRVGPYADQKSADIAKKGLESAGFKAIVKH
jgi:DedD protein